jgi:hypothetical protein
MSVVLLRPVHPMGLLLVLGRNCIFDYLKWLESIFCFYEVKMELMNLGAGGTTEEVTGNY